MLLRTLSGKKKRDTVENADAQTKYLSSVSSVFRMAKQLYINFTDFKNAFDSIHRESVWRKLRAYGIPIDIVNFFRNVYSNFTSSSTLSLSGYYDVQQKANQEVSDGRFFLF